MISCGDNESGIHYLVVCGQANDWPVTIRNYAEFQVMLEEAHERFGVSTQLLGMVDTRGLWKLGKSFALGFSGPILEFVRIDDAMNEAMHDDRLAA